jgi:hypothetical protein
MNEYVKSTPIHDLNSHKHNRSAKPYWCYELTNLWKNMKKAESKFLKNRNDTGIHDDYKIKRKTFCRELRRAERKCKHEQIGHIENICTNDPKKFWSYIKRLGPKKNSSIPEKVYVNNTLTGDLTVVLNAWQNEFFSLYNERTNTEDFEIDFYEEALRSKEIAENLLNDPVFNDNALLNIPIAFQEVQLMVKGLKNNKSTGIDQIPYEVFRNNDVMKILFNMYRKCFIQGKIPSSWRKAIIAPIFKNGKKDPHEPLNYRGISLLSCISKGFTNIINKRLSDYYETFRLFAEEQNGFRSGRACIDHIFSLTSIIRNAIAKKSEIFACFVDFQKAFDFVDRDLLMYKLLSDNVNGKFYEVIKSIYSSTMACIRINGKHTNWFDINHGVRQGDSLSTTLFAIYINDLAQELNNLKCGIDFNESHISTLFYADDIVLISNNAENLQQQILCVYNWCKKWKMSINIDKTKVIHFRSKRTPQTSNEFMLGNSRLEKASQYKYLGVMLDEKLNFGVCAELLSGAASRALGSIVSKFNTMRNVGYNTFNKLLHSNVCPILDYCSGVWGFGTYKSCDKIQLRRIIKHHY